MTESTVHHATIELQHRYRASTAEVFAAWSRREALLDWGAPGDGWWLTYDRFDFRVGHTDVCRFGEDGGAEYVNAIRYEDLVPEHRIVYASTLSSGGKLGFVGVVTVELAGDHTGCVLSLTEQGVYLDGPDDADCHRAGWDDMLGKLGAYLARSRKAA